MPVSSLFEIIFFFPWTIQQPAIYNQCLCSLDAYNKHLNANICGSVQKSYDLVCSDIINLQ